VEGGAVTDRGSRGELLQSCDGRTPAHEGLEAARIVAKSIPDIVIAITGRPKLERIGWAENVPSNVRLTGFLSEHDFESRLLGASVVVSF
jgi:hypothetical protein